MSFLMGLNEGWARRGPGLGLGGGAWGLGPGNDPVGAALSPRNDPVVKSTVIILSDAFFAEELSGEAEVDCTGFVESFKIFGAQGQVDCFEVFV